MSLNSLRGRAANLWRYGEVMPVRDAANIVSLGEGFTPLLHAPRLGGRLGVPNLWFLSKICGSILVLVTPQGYGRAPLQPL